MTTTKHLADVVHGTIHYSGIEGEIIGTPAFNRLHNILQSSVVYLTYPSNKVKRFEHSVGTMKIAGDLFYHSICNTENPEDYENFFTEIKKEIINWRKQTKHKDVSFIREDIYCKKYTESKILQAPVPSCRLYNMYAPGNLKDEDKLAYFVAFQSVRLCGLLHDVGHLPYSHVLESFLKKLFNEICSKENSSLNEKEKRFKEILSTFITEKQNKPVDAIHEKLGIFLFSKIFNSITGSLPISGDETRIFLALVIYFSKRILSSNENNDLTKKDVFRDLHRITSGVLDADRLDYCNRDLSSVGIKRGDINYGRLLSSIKVKEIVVQEKPLSKPRSKLQITFNGFCFCSAIKHINEIENLISLRWDDFFYINYHHRVHKHEILMEEVLIGLANNWFQDDSESICDLDVSVILPLKISSIWEILKQISEDKPIEYLLLQLDDNWLNTLLKKEFFEIYQKTYTLYSDHADEPLWHRFDEIISSKKHYCSLLKGNDSFREFDELFFNELKNIVKKAEKKGSIKIPAVLQNINKTDYLTFVSQKGFYFNYVMRALTFKDEIILDFIEKTVNASLNNDENLINVLIRKSQFGLGYTTITNPVYVYSINGDVDKLEHRSQQLGILQKKQYNSPFFHCYYLPKFDVNQLIYSDIDQINLMKKLCKCSAQTIFELFTNKKKEGDNNS